MKKLIRQIRSFGSLFKGYGVHVSIIMRKPKVSFRTPTYLIGGSNCSFARQGGFISILNRVCFIYYLSVAIRQAFITKIMFLRENIDRIKGIDHRFISMGLYERLEPRNPSGHLMPLTP